MPFALNRVGWLRQTITLPLVVLIALIITAQQAVPADPPLDVTAIERERLRQAFTAFKRDDAPAALDLLHDLADGGNADAQYLAAEILWHRFQSQAVHNETSLVTAKEWARRAATQHHAGGLLLHAAILRSDCNISARSFSEALEAIRKAAALGLSDAQTELAWVHLDHGRITKEALAFAEQAADNGKVFGQLAAGLLSMFPASWLDADRTDTSGQQRAAAYFKQAAEQGLVDAQVLYAQMLADGIGIQRDPNEAFRWFVIAETLGWEQAGADALDLAMQLSANQADATRKEAAAWIDIMLPDDSRPIGPALAWCDENRTGDMACRRAALWEDAACLPLDLPVTPLEGFRQSKVYRACRMAMRDDGGHC